jgi:hypothetical protein
VEVVPALILNKEEADPSIWLNLLIHRKGFRRGTAHDVKTYIELVGNKKGDTGEYFSDGNPTTQQFRVPVPVNMPVLPLVKYLPGDKQSVWYKVTIRVNITDLNFWERLSTQLNFKHSKVGRSRRMFSLILGFLSDQEKVDLVRKGGRYRREQALLLKSLQEFFIYLFECVYDGIDVIVNFQDDRSGVRKTHTCFIETVWMYYLKSAVVWEKELRQIKKAIKRGEGRCAQ